MYSNLHSNSNLEYGFILYKTFFVPFIKVKEKMLVPGYTTYPGNTYISEKLCEDNVHNSCFSCENA